MRILIDGLSARIGGGITYIKQILPAIADMKTEHEFFVLFSSQYQQELIASIPASIQVVTVDLPPIPLYKRWAYLQTGLVTLIKSLKIELFFAPAESSYLRIPVSFVMLARNPSIYAMPMAFGNQWMQLIKHRLARELPVFLSMRHADRILFVSRTFGQQVTRQMWLNPAKTQVIYHGVNSMFFLPSVPLNELSPREPYFLMVSSINPHKNHETLIRAYAQLPPQAPQLLIAGKALDTTTYANLEKIVSTEKLEGRVIFLGMIPYEKLPALYQGAIASIIPSRLETFGHPLVEAMAAQVPVIASNLPVCHEICGDAALYFDPDDVKTLAKHLQDVWHDANLREQMVKAGNLRASTFSWNECARQLLNVFETCVVERRNESS